MSPILHLVPGHALEPSRTGPYPWNSALGSCKSGENQLCWLEEGKDGQHNTRNLPVKAVTREKREKKREKPHAALQSAMKERERHGEKEAGPGAGAEQGWGMALRRIQGLGTPWALGTALPWGARTEGREGWGRWGIQQDWSKAWPRLGERGDIGLEGRGAARKNRMGVLREGESQGKSALEHQCETKKGIWNEFSWRSWGIKAGSPA